MAAPKREKRERKAIGTQDGLELVVTGANRVIMYAAPKQIPNAVPYTLGLKTTTIPIKPSKTAAERPNLQIMRKNDSVTNSVP